MKKLIYDSKEVFAYEDQDLILIKATASTDMKGSPIELESEAALFLAKTLKLAAKEWKLGKNQEKKSFHISNDLQVQETSFEIYYDKTGIFLKAINNNLAVPTCLTELEAEELSERLKIVAQKIYDSEQG